VGWRRWEDGAGPWGGEDKRDGPAEAGLVRQGREQGPCRPRRCRVAVDGAAAGERPRSSLCCFVWGVLLLFWVFF